MNFKVKNMIYCSMFACIIALLAQIKIDLPGYIPITLQTLGVYLAGCTLKPKEAFFSVLVYLLMGAIGLPVFSGFTGGISSIVSYAGGYIIGFVFMALIISIIVNINDTFITKIISCVIGTLVCYAFGTIWFMIYTQMNLLPALMMCVAPFLLGDSIKIIIAVILSSKIKLK